jgi:hypothetical protein
VWVLFKVIIGVCMGAVVFSCRGLCIGLIIVQRSPTECGVCECDREVSTTRRPWPTRGCCAMGGGGGSMGAA